tara:strand:- start:148 stop:429 length:282 start_codon:yes stop_codon:yes gene_type:complete
MNLNPNGPSFQKVLKSMDPKQVMDMLGRVGESTYVIINKTGTSIVEDPGLSRPWSTHNKKLAEVRASEIGHGASVLTLADAVKQLIKAQIARN